MKIPPAMVPQDITAVYQNSKKQLPAILFQKTDPISHSKQLQQDKTTCRKAVYRQKHLKPDHGHIGVR